jgi:hypothetical protein
MSKIQKEVDLYKDLPPRKLKKVIRQYKSLSWSNSDKANFLFYFATFGAPYFFWFDVTIGSVLFFILVHYFLFWKFFFGFLKFKLVSDSDRIEIDQIIEILEGHLKEKQNKKPLD